MLIPHAGFLSTFIAGDGAFIGLRSLRGSPHGAGVATGGRVTAMLVFAPLAGIATVWNVFIADPAVRDYEELQDVIEHIKDLSF